MYECVCVHACVGACGERETERERERECVCAFVFMSVCLCILIFDITNTMIIHLMQNKKENNNNI